MLALRPAFGVLCSFAAVKNRLCVLASFLSILQQHEMLREVYDCLVPVHIKIDKIKYVSRCQYLDIEHSLAALVGNNEAA